MWQKCSIVIMGSVLRDLLPLFRSQIIKFMHFIQSQRTAGKSGRGKLASERQKQHWPSKFLQTKFFLPFPKYLISRIHQAFIQAAFETAAKIISPSLLKFLFHNRQKSRHSLWG